MGLYGVSPDFIQLQYDWKSMHINYTIYELDDKMFENLEFLLNM